MGRLGFVSDTFDRWTGGGQDDTGVEKMKKEKARIEAEHQKELEKGGISSMPKYPGLINPLVKNAQGQYVMRDDLQVQPWHIVQDKNTTLDQTGYNHLKGMLGANNPWFQMQQQNLNNQYGQALNQNVHQTRVAERAGLNSLAASGGFDAGSRERMARGVQTQGMLGAQGLAANNATNRLNLGIANQQMQADLAGRVQGMDMDMKNYNLGIDKYNTDVSNRAAEQNVNNTLLSMGGMNQFRINRYGEAMRGWAGEKTAQATAGSGKKGPFG